jgi:hypothetical protein
LPWRRALVITAAAGAATALATARLPSAEVWASLTPGVCDEYCENSTRCGPLATRPAIQQPLNAWSNFAYLFAGLLALRRPLRPTAILFAASAAVLAAGSFLFHAAITREFQWLDMVGTYAALVAVLAHGAAVAFGVAQGIAVGGALVLDALFAVFKWRIDATVALPVLIAAVAAPMTTVVRARRATARAALLPLALVAVAFALRQMDVAGIACAPESRLYQGHAAWHVLTAASLAASFLCFERASAAERA